jgi:hypothetical protein
VCRVAVADTLTYTCGQVRSDPRVGFELDSASVMMLAPLPQGQRGARPQRWLPQRLTTATTTTSYCTATAGLGGRPCRSWTCMSSWIGDARGVVGRPQSQQPLVAELRRRTLPYGTALDWGGARRPADGRDGIARKATRSAHGRGMRGSYL